MGGRIHPSLLFFFLMTIPKTKTRKLLTGGVAQEKKSTHELVIYTKVPSKWLFVDLETGTVWQKGDQKNSWSNFGYVDSATHTSITILPTAHGSIPRFGFK